MTDRDPDEGHDVDRQLDELLSELRVLLPGVTVIFAFLLTVPFSSGFAESDDIQRAAYTVALLTSGAATVLLMGLAAYHRLGAGRSGKARMIRTATRQSVVALAVTLPALLLGLAAATWFGLPLWRKRSGIERR